MDGSFSILEGEVWMQLQEEGVSMEGECFLVLEQSLSNAEMEQHEEIEQFL